MPDRPTPSCPLSDEQIEAIAGRDELTGDAILDFGRRLLAAAGGSPDWIETSKRAPRPGETVFAFWAPSISAVHVGCFGVATMATPAHWHNPENDEDDYIPPTHWMPLRPPPCATAAVRDQAPADPFTVSAALRRLIGDDAYAMTFQTMGQYRSALLKAIGDAERAAAPAESVRPVEAQSKENDRG